MGILAISLAVVSGICLGTGAVHLFIGLRRQGTDMSHFTFGLFALAYGGAVLTGLLMYRSTSLPEFLAADRWSGVFAGATYVFLIWFVAIYTGVQPLPFLGVLTVLFGTLVAAHVSRPTLLHGEIAGIALATLPWGEQIAFLNAGDSIWELLFFLAQLLTMCFLFYACVRQYRRGERGAALALGAGLSLFVFSLVVDFLVEGGLIDFVLLSDFGFLPLAIVMSLQLSNQVIRTEEELAGHRNRLEAMVEERTAELERANQQLSRQIAERRQAEEAVRQSNRTARALLNAPPDSALLIDPQGIILDINEVAAERLGTSEAEARGRAVYDLFEKEVAVARQERVAEVLATRQPVRWEDVRLGQYIDNTLYPVLDDGGQVVSIAVFDADVTERRQAEAVLRRHAEEVAVNEERSRLARDLHDSVTQTLYSASLIAEALPRVQARNPDEVQGNLTTLLRLIRGALAEMRTLLFELRPTALEKGSLDRLLHQLGDLLTGRTQIPVEVTIQGQVDLPVEVKLPLYRIAQEAFNNIAKHAGASRVTATLQNLPDQVVLTIQDDGDGFDPHSIPAERMGLRIMRERAGEIGGELAVESTLGQGTRVVVSWLVDGRRRTKDE